ncbi:hypothetical protein [Brucella pituitosa]|uniref:hypothetical protein n=1 Tax=Brucella pituitosa TaxID=571256 RepID=UPI003F4A9FCA
MGKFKVGDRVQVVDDRGGRNIGETGEIIGIDITFSPAFYYIKWDAGVAEQGLYENRLELLPVAGATGKPALKIEAGKYYRTRDGRKVGPMRRYVHRDDLFDVVGGGVFGASLWRGNGTAVEEEDAIDLIAEWVDEPVKAAAPVAAQQDTSELTVKLSFDAADVTNAIKSTLLKTNQGYGFEIARHGDYVWVDTGKKVPIVLKATDVQAAA